MSGSASAEEEGLNLDFLQGGRNAQAAAFLGVQSEYFLLQYFVDVPENGIPHPMGKRFLTVMPQDRSQLCFSPDWLAGMVYLRPEFLPKPYVRRVSVTPRGNRWISVTGWSRLAGKTFLSSQNRGSR